MSFVDNQRIFNIGASGKSPLSPSISNPNNLINVPRPAETIIIPYTGWSSWKNNVSGNFTRSVCDSCKDICEGQMSNTGLYPLSRVNLKPISQKSQPVLQGHRQRISNPINYTYLDDPGVQLGSPYKPFKYERGWWPDEYLNTFNEPDPLQHISLDQKITYLRMIQGSKCGSNATFPPKACKCLNNVK